MQSKVKPMQTEKRTPPAPKPCLAAYALPSAEGSLNYTFTPLGRFPSKAAAKRALAEVVAEHPAAVYLVLEAKRKTPSVIFDLLAAEAQKRGIGPTSENTEKQP